MMDTRILITLVVLTAAAFDVVCEDTTRVGG